MPDQTDTSNDHVKPFVYQTLSTKALHFSICEIQSRMQTQRPDALDLDYTRTMMAALLFNSRPDTLAMIGLGGGSLAKFCYRHLPNTRIKVVEINPHVIALRDEFQVPADDDRFKVRRGDGADFVRFPPYKVDMLMVDGFDSQGQPPALCSQRFYDNCYEALQPDGLMVVNLHSGHRHFDSFVSRMQRSFGDEVVVVPDRDCSNSIAFACKGLLMRRFKPALLRRPAGFDASAWEELMPAFANVTAVVRQWQQSQC